MQLQLYRSQRKIKHISLFLLPTSAVHQYTATVSSTAVYCSASSTAVATANRTLELYMDALFLLLSIHLIYNRIPDNYIKSFADNLL